MIVGRLHKAVIGLAALALLGSCGPALTNDPAKLKAIRADALLLMVSHRPGKYPILPKRSWPTAIAALRPEVVLVSQAGVDIVIKPYFDGGWGYYVPLDPREVPEPKGRYEAAGEGVYWFHPY